MNNWLVSTTAGGALTLFGLLLIRSHVRSWHRQKDDPSLEDSDRRHFHAQFRRRIQTSALFVVIGLLISIGVLLIDGKKTPGLFGYFWMAVLLLALWVVFLGMGDLFLVSTHSRAALARLRNKQRTLEDQLARMKQHRSNGDHTSD